jgi:hypothetical protein
MLPARVPSAGRQRAEALARQRRRSLLFTGSWPRAARTRSVPPSNDKDRR